MTGVFVQSEAFVGKAFLSVGNGASPEVFTRYCEVTDIGDMGEKNDQVEVTTFCSDGFKQFIAGLSEGQEQTFTGNYSLDNTTQDDLIDDVANKRNRSFQLSFGDDSPVTKVYSFTLAMLSWAITPSVSKQNVVKFSGKQTGPIVRTIA